MKKMTYCVSFLLLSLALKGQKYDYQWPMGYGANFQFDFGVSILDFNNGLVDNYPLAEVENFEVGNNASFICNDEGELILMTNNCEIVDRNFQVVPGSEMLTPGPTHEIYCPDGFYPSDQATLFIPEMSNDSVYYLAHKDSEISSALQDVLSKNVYLSLVVQKEDSTFYLKEKIHLLEEDLNWGRLTGAVNHTLDKWWLVVIGYNSNRFYTFLVGGDNIVEGPFIQDIGIDLINQELDIGQIAFSPDGNHLAINNKAHGIVLYDFDNETGTLSNFRIIAYPNMESCEGLVFSPNSTFIYTTTANDLYQIEWGEPNLSLAIRHIAYVEEIDKTNWPYALGQMYLGPDCRIYVSPGSTTYYIHVIHHPNEKGMNCMFQNSAIRMPTNLLHDLPNIPMYRFDGACDGNIDFVVKNNEEPKANKPVSIHLFPNPSASQVTLYLDTNQYDHYDLTLFDQFGRQVLAIKDVESNKEKTINLNALPVGWYSYRLSTTNGLVVKSGSLSVQR